MTTSPSCSGSNPRPAPIWSAPCSTTLEPSTPSNDASANSANSWITRHVWVVQHRNGWWLDENGLWTDRLEWAWKPLDSYAAASRVQQLKISPTVCRLRPLTLTARPCIPWKWRANG